MNEKLIHGLKALGGSVLGSVAAFLLSTDGVEAIKAALPHTPVFVIVALLAGTIIHGLGTAVQSAAAALSTDETAK